MDLSELEFGARKHGGYNATACQFCPDAVHERVRVDLRAGHFASVDEDTDLTIDHPFGYCGCGLVPGVVAQDWEPPHLPPDWPPPPDGDLDGNLNPGLPPDPGPNQDLLLDPLPERNHFAA